MVNMVLGRTPYRTQQATSLDWFLSQGQDSRHLNLQLACLGGQFMILEYYGNDVSLLPMGIRLKMALMCHILPVALVIFKVPVHSRLSSLKAKENHLTDISTSLLFPHTGQLAAPEETNSPTLVQRVLFHMIMWKN